MSTPGTLRFPQIAVSPPTPPAGTAFIYIKTDGVLYLKDSTGAEVALGSASAITSLVGDVIASGPGAATATVVSVGGQPAADVAAAVVAVENATAANIVNRLVLRDGSGNFSAGTITANLNGNAATATSATSAINFTGSLAGDVTGTQSATVVSNVGGSSASAVHSATVAANAATHLNTASTIVKRDASGNFAANKIDVADLDISDDLAVGDDASVGGDLTVVGTITAANLSGTNTGDVTVTDSDTVNLTLSGQDITADVKLADSTIDSNSSGIKVAAGGITNTHINASANIAYSKLNLSGSIVDSDISSSAAISRSKLAAGIANRVIVNNGSGAISEAAAITPNRVLISDANGLPTHSIVTASELAALSGIDVSAHASRHLPSGADPLTTDAPTTNLSPATTNATGTANSFARSDHTHAIETGVAADITTIQPDDAASAGTLNKFARADHRHAINTAAPVTQLPDQSNSEGTSTSFARADHVHNIPTDVPVQIGTSNVAGSSDAFARADHVHSHGNQTNPNLHALATASAHGFMSSTDKTKIDAALPATLGSANQVLGVNNVGTAGEYKTISGTTNRVSVTHSAGNITLSTPQDIHAGATPEFSGANFTNRLELTEQTAPAIPAADKIRIYAEDSNGLTRVRMVDDKGLIMTLSRDVIFTAKNTTGATITKGRAVYANGSDPAAGVITVALAQANSSATVPVIGITLENISDGGFGRVLSSGIISGIDTSAFSAGQRLFLSATVPGGLTATKPSKPNLWQRVAVVIKSGASDGVLQVRSLDTHGEESGTNTGWTANVVALTDAPTITLDASQGNIFTVTLGGNRTLAAPTNPTDGQKITLRIRQDSVGGRTLTFDPVYNFGADLAGITLSTSANAFDYIGMQYNGVTSKWDVLAITRNY